VYTAAAKCTLMANIPRGDIELSFTSPSTAAVRSSGQRHEKTPYMRIRFSRQCQFVELSQHVSGAQGEEWTKKSIPSTDSSPFISTDNWTTLEDAEKEAIQQLVHFVRTCEAAEGLLLLDELPMSQTTNRARAGSLKPLTPRLQTPPLETNIAYSTPTLANSLLSGKLTRRPAKLSTTSTIRNERHGENSEPLGRSTKNDVPSENLRSTLNAIDPAEWCAEEFTDGNRAIETRFLPSVGWCIRYGSRVSQGGRFRVMFLDGIALDVDVDEDWAELRSQSGNATR
jgi:polo-like kinase 4